MRHMTRQMVQFLKLVSDMQHIANEFQDFLRVGCIMANPGLRSESSDWFRLTARLPQHGNEDF